MTKVPPAAVIAGVSLKASTNCVAMSAGFTFASLSFGTELTPSNVEGAAANVACKPNAQNSINTLKNRVNDFLIAFVFKLNLID
jgi:hypothetical protein